MSRRRDPAELPPLKLRRSGRRQERRRQRALQEPVVILPESITATAAPEAPADDMPAVEPADDEVPITEPAEPIPAVEPSGDEVPTIGPAEAIPAVEPDREQPAEDVPPTIEPAEAVPAVEPAEDEVPTIGPAEAIPAVEPVGDLPRDSSAEDGDESPVAESAPTLEISAVDPAVVVGGGPPGSAVAEPVLAEEAPAVEPVADGAEPLKDAPAVEPVADGAEPADDMAAEDVAADDGTRKAPLYWRLLRLRHVHPNGWQRALLLEGVIAVALILVLAGKASAWTLLVLPVVVAALVKAHDLLVGGLSGVTRSDEPVAEPAGADAPASLLMSVKTYPCPSTDEPSQTERGDPGKEG